MSDSLTILLANRPVRVHLPPGQIEEGVRERTEGYWVRSDRPPWLDVRVTERQEPANTEEKLLIHKDDGGNYIVRSGSLRGLVRRPGQTRPYEATVEATDGRTACRYLHLCLSLLLPREGALLLHADTVAYGGKAYAFLGRSEAGKSTAADNLARLGGGRQLAEDRTAVLSEKGGAEIVTMPRLPREEIFTHGQERWPLAALVFPKKEAAGVRVEETPKAEALQRVLMSSILPPGKGLPVEDALKAAEKILSVTRAMTLAYWKEEPFAQKLSKAVEEAK